MGRNKNNAYASTDPYPIIKILTIFVAKSATPTEIDYGAYSTFILVLQELMCVH